MKKQRLITRLFISYIVLAISAIFLLIFFSSKAIEKFYFDQKISDLRARAEFVKECVLMSGLQDSNQLQESCRRIGNATQTRITLINNAGKVLADSEEDPQKMDNHGDRPEVIEAIQNEEGLSRRYSFTLEQEHLYLAKKLSSQIENLIIRVSFSTKDLDDALNSIKVDLLIIGILVILLFSALNWYLSRSITRPIDVMEEGAKRFAAGKLKLKIPESNISELASLARSLNEMADQLYERIKAITQHKNEQIAILSSMTEGVIALDADGVVLSLNTAAAEMFDVKHKKIIGQKLYEIIRHAELNTFIASILEKQETLFRQLSVFGAERRLLNVIGSVMPSKKGNETGIVIVLSDLTQIHKLERVRRDFVANVSHELKTPITSIKGYVETLQDGALDDKENAAHFLEIISRHTDRLSEIIDDLLELSRIEEISKNDEKYIESVYVKTLFEKLVMDYQSLIDQKNIRIVVDVDEDIKIDVNIKMMIHALGNLLDNALKYSNQDTNIILRGFRLGMNTIIEVVDQGLGIENVHIDRIFERFYRVDKGRSRDVGGTGLGLSIVKHIARLHHAKIEVESELGMGSTFRLVF